MSKHFLLPLSIAVVIVAAAGAVTWYFAKPAHTPQSPGPSPLAEEVVIEGEAVCLPHKNTSGAQTLECALGVKDDSNQYYGLGGISGEMPATGSQIRVSGRLATPGSDERYDVIGNITVVQLTKL